MLKSYIKKEKEKKEKEMLAQDFHSVLIPNSSIHDQIQV